MAWCNNPRPRRATKSREFLPGKVLWLSRGSTAAATRSGSESGAPAPGRNGLEGAASGCAWDRGSVAVLDEGRAVAALGGGPRRATLPVRPTRATRGWIGARAQDEAVAITGGDVAATFARSGPVQGELSVPTRRPVRPVSVAAGYRRVGDSRRCRATSISWGGIAAQRARLRWRSAPALAAPTGVAVAVSAGVPRRAHTTWSRPDLRKGAGIAGGGAPITAVAAPSRV